MRGLVIIVVVAMGCGPSVGVDNPDSDGSSAGDATSGFASDEGVSQSGGEATSESGMPPLDTSTGSPLPPPPACGDGTVDEGEACDDGNLDGGDGCDAQCRVAGTELWKIFLPTLAVCPQLAALDDGGVVAVGWERPTRSTGIPHVAVVDTDASIRWATQGGYASYDTTSAVVAEPGGFVVVGRTGEYFGDSVGWIQRWSAKGPKIDEALFGEHELGEDIFEIERRDDTTFWIVARDDESQVRRLFARELAEPPTIVTPLPDTYVLRLAPAPDGGAYVASDHVDALLTRFDVDGTAIWTLPYDGPLDPPPGVYAIASTIDGDAIVTGKDHDGPWIRRFDPDGTELWRAPVDVGALPDKDYPRHVAVDGMDGIVVAGDSYVPREGNDAFLAKYDGDGVELWQQTWLSDSRYPVDITMCDVVTTIDGTVLVAGVGVPTGEFGDGYWLRAFTP